MNSRKKATPGGASSKTHGFEVADLIEAFLRECSSYIPWAKLNQSPSFDSMTHKKKMDAKEGIRQKGGKLAEALERIGEDNSDVLKVIHCVDGGGGGVEGLGRIWPAPKITLQGIMIRLRCGTADIPGMTRQDARDKLLGMVESNEPYTSVDNLAKRVGCSKTTVHEAIQSFPKLKEWQAKSAKKSPGTRSLNAVDLDNRLGDEDDPADIAAGNEQLDTVFAKLLQEATPEERADWNSKTPEQQHDLARLHLEQEKEIRIEDKAKKGNILLGRKP
ncbi:MAG: hypothetical protein V1809_03300 [Planctomycetota bacterium]